ncbi:hypothetical protein MJ575_14120 [Klebsiella pneumoniae]|nr:hypothetical protein MJ575_14120 [Klebsiella pneumoniae]
MKICSQTLLDEHDMVVERLKALALKRSVSNLLLTTEDVENKTGATLLLDITGR